MWLALFRSFIYTVSNLCSYDHMKFWAIGNCRVKLWCGVSRAERKQWSAGWTWNGWTWMTQSRNQAVGAFRNYCGEGYLWRWRGRGGGAWRSSIHQPHNLRQPHQPHHQAFAQPYFVWPLMTVDSKMVSMSVADISTCLFVYYLFARLTTT